MDQREKEMEGRCLGALSQINARYDTLKDLAAGPDHLIARPTATKREIRKVLSELIDAAAALRMALE